MTAWWFALAWAGAPMSAAWTTTLPAAPSGDGVELLGVDAEGRHGWLQVHEEGARSLWQVDLRRARVDGVWRGEASDSAAGWRWGALYPLVQSAEELQRLLLVRGHIAGVGRWPRLSVATEGDGPWVAWERPTRAGGDGIALRGPDGPLTLPEGLYAAYRPRFDRAGERVAYTATGRPTRYRVFVQPLDGGEAEAIDGLGHASWFEWDRQDRLWVLSSGDGADAGCLHVVHDGVSRPVACPEDPTTTTMALMDPEGGLVVMGWYRGEGVDTALEVVAVRTADEREVARRSLPEGRLLQALRHDGRLVVGALDSTDVVDLSTGEMARLPDDLRAPVSVHWVDGRLPMLQHRSWTKDVTVVWVDPDEALAR